ncbi:hypothetical protein A7U60_g9097 [Sanghuangporus baumii]|uniref:Signal peptidase complex subunit 1 n=1 Tax=Sanghuangporus baumii TaxID=108892 RepID=A0A9Q5HQ20_SANBA|nr:hypothetical protein A7U60_g9097 [Sanghuangporus baumii]
MASILQDALEGKIDFEGQRHADWLVRNALIATTILSFILGFAFHSLRVTFGTLALGTVLLIVAVVPPWPMYRKHPAKWLPVKKPTKSE